MLLLGEQLSASPPAVFDDYFEQDVKVAASLHLEHFFSRFDINYQQAQRRVYRDVSGGSPHTEGGDQGLSSRRQMDATFGKVKHDWDHWKLYYFKNIFLLLFLYINEI